MKAETEILKIRKGPETTNTFFLRRHSFIMADFSSNVKQKFNLLLSQMSENRWLYVNHPQSDFTRQDTGKLTFSDTMRLIIGMGKSTTNDEISEYFDLDPDRIP